MKRGAPLPFLCALLLAAGCATAPPADGDGEEDVPPEEAPETADAESSAPADGTPGPAAGPKPWTVKLEHGRALARVDGVRVFLDAPAKTDWKSKKTSASWLDRKATLGPLLDARSEPLVRDRPFRICIDPGHGGSDPGAASRDGKTAESVLTLDVSRRVRALLEADGFDVQLTRWDAATDQTLEERAAKARRWKADAFVSVHFNTNPGSAAARGLETYVFPANGMESTSYSGRRPSPEAKLPWRGSASNVGNVQLGFCIQRRLLAATGLPD
ncbi:MAG: N-acetylmuramoyl-L-alanine amidase, partial [Kiritimatiellae bacterium]|nr:N-acetylmuramoyl-L-alanine amidase [Kiritimatiellia bacterium]